MPTNDMYYNKKKALDYFCSTFDLSDAGKIKGDIQKRKNRLEILIRYINAIDVAAAAEDMLGLTFSGERPNDHDPLGNYIISGGRIFFDLSALNCRQKEEFKNFLFPKNILNVHNSVITKLLPQHMIL